MVLVKSVSIDIGVKGDRDSKAKLDEITRRAEALKKAFPEYKLKIDSAAAAERLRVFRAQLAEATKDRTANVKVKVDDSALAKFADKMKKSGGPWWLGPSLLGLGGASALTGVGAGAAIGLGGAAVAGAGTLAAFGAVAKPVLADAQKAQQQINAAQNAFNISAGRVHTAITTNAADAKIYTAALKGLTPAQQQVEKLLGVQGTSWGDLSKAQQNAAISLLEDKAALKAMLPDQVAALRNLVGFQKIYAEMSPQQIALSVQLGKMAQAWQNLKAAQTPVVAGALLPWLKSVTDLTGNLAPVIAKVSPVIGMLGTQFDHLINDWSFQQFKDFIGSTGSAAVSAAGSTLIDFVKGFMILLPKFDPLIREAVGWISRLGPAFATWASSKKATDAIQGFIRWFSQNGPAAGALLKNIGGALKALAPGLTAGGALEIKVISDFLGLVARLPKGLAKPLFETAGALLLLNKIGVVSVGIKFTGLGAGAVGAAAGAEAGSAAAAGLGGGLIAGGAGIAGGLFLKIREELKTGWKGIVHDLPQWLGGVGGILNLSATGWTNAILDKFDKPVRAMWHSLGHFMAGSFDDTRHQVAHIADNLGGFLAGSFGKTRGQVAAIWNLTWANTITRTARGFRDVAGWFDAGRHNIARTWDIVRRDTAGIWDTTWNNTVGRAARGVHDVVSWFGNLRAGAVLALSRLGPDLAIMGKWALTSLWDGMKAGARGIGGWLAGFAKGVVQVFKDIWHWFSPSGVMYEGGKALMQGLSLGLKDHSRQAIANAAAVAQAVTGALGAGVQRWAPVVLQALKMEQLPASLLGDVLYQMQTESGGNPNAQNNTDINAQLGDPSRGLMQVIGATFRYWHWPGTSWNIFDPLANIAAALNYAAHGKGFGSGAGQIGSGHGYALGTPSAAPGWAWVGEHGPELMRFRGGEQVGPVQPAFRSGPATCTIIIKVDPAIAAVTPDRTLGRNIAQHVTQFISGGGRLYPAGVVPR